MCSSCPSLWGGAGGGPGSWQGGATGTWHGTARCCSPSPRSALLIASGTRVLQKNSSWKESTSPGLPVGWEGGKQWAWSRQEAARRAGGACRGHGYWAGGLLGGGLSGMGQEASCPWQGGAGSRPMFSGWGWRMLDFERGVVRNRNCPPRVFLLCIAEQQLLGLSVSALRLPGLSTRGEGVLLAASGPLNVGSVTSALPLALMGSVSLPPPDGDCQAAQCDLRPAHPVPVSGGG